jgi:hypothetical protein
MPKLVDATDLGGLPAVRASTPISDGGLGAVADAANERARLALNQGNAFAGLGDSISRAALSLQDGWDKINAYGVQAQWEQFKTNEAKLYDEATREMQPGQAQGFADKWAAGYDQRAREFFANVPESLKPQYDVALRSYRENAYYGDGQSSGALGFERGEQRRYALNSLGDVTSNALLPRVEQAAKLPDGDPDKPKQLQSIQEDGFKLVDDNPALTPVEKDEAKRKLKEVLQLSFAKALPASERQLVDPSTGRQTIAQRIVLVESGGDPTIENPASTAVGAGQFTEGTWLSMVGKYRPDLIKGRSRAQILEMRKDPTLALDMVQRYSEENARYLGARGFGATPGNLYLAHFLGPQGAVAVLGSDQGTTGESIAPAAAKANPSVFYRVGSNGKVDFSQPKTVGEIRQWAAGKMAGAEHTDWSTVLDGISYDQKINIAQDAAKDLLAQQTVAAQQRDNEYKGRINLLSNMILDGKAGRTEIDQAYDGGSGWLTNAGDRGKLYELVEKVQKDGLTLARATQRVTGEGALNPFNDDDRRDIDTYYEKGVLGGGATLLDDDPQAATSLDQLVAKHGYVPKAAAAVLKMGMRSADGNQWNRAYSILDGLYQQNPAAVIDAIGADNAKKLDVFRNLSGVVPDDIVREKLNPFADPRVLDLQDKMEAQGRKIAASMDAATLTARFDKSWLPFSAPGAPVDAITNQAMLRDWQTEFAVAYGKTDGDEDKAAELAFKWLSYRWGATETGSHSYVMENPPERFFNDVGGNKGWLDEQLDDKVEREFPGAQSWSLVGSLPITTGPAGAKQMPQWAIRVVDKDGALQLVMPPSGAPPGWPFDEKSARQKAWDAFSAGNPEAQRLRAGPLPVQPGEIAAPPVKPFGTQIPGEGALDVPPGWERPQ